MAATTRDSEYARKLVYRAIDALNAQLPPDHQIAKAADTVLRGAGGSLDSLGFVEMTMLLQEFVLDECNRPIAVADGTLLADSPSPGGADGPFRTVGTLVEHLAGILANQQPAELFYPPKAA